MSQTPTPQLIRTVTVSDSGTPATAQGLLDCEDLRFLTVECFLSAGSSCTLTPLFWNPLAEKYSLGDAYTIDADYRLNVAVDGTRDFFPWSQD